MNKQITCNQCHYVFSVESVDVSQTVRCPECGECVAVPAMMASAETELSSVSLQHPVWKWRDIFIGIGAPVFVYGLVYMFRVTGAYSLPWVQLSLMLVMTLVLLVVSLGLYRKRMHSWPFKPITIKSFMIESLWALLYAAVVFLCFFLTESLLGKFVSTQDASSGLGRFDAFAQNNIIYLGILVYAFTIAPFYEEVYFRGFFYNALKNRMHWVAAGLIQALVFAVLHPYGWLGIIKVFLGAVVFMFLYEHRKRLLTPILAHAQVNFVTSAMLIGLFIMNYHTPAQNWEQARINPSWLSDTPPAYIQKQESGKQQCQYAVETWGSQGMRLWKKEANAFNAIQVWFPEDGQACAQAKIGLVSIYLNRLRDYRRAIVEADELLEHGAANRKTQAMAWLYKAQAYAALGDNKKSREAADVVVSEYSDCEAPKKAAEKLLEERLSE